MWYVNAVTENLRKLGQKGFILTMWYVNVYKYEFIPEYVQSFILTMWYVNLLYPKTYNTSATVLY